MTIPPQPPGGSDANPPHWGLLLDLAQRLAGGIQPGIAEAGISAPTQPLLRHARVQSLHDRGLKLMSNGSTPSVTTVSRQITEVATELAANRTRLLRCLYHPLSWAESLLIDNANPLDGHASWALWCHMVEALWQVVSGDVPNQTGGQIQGTQLSEVDCQLVRPLAARLRFLVLSEAFRHRNDGSAWLPPDTVEPAGHVPFTVIFGEGTWHLLMTYARQARWIWKECLDTHESHPLLAQARPDQIEDEVDALLFSNPRPAGPLQITPDPLDYDQSAGADDSAIRRDVAERHLLPRFQLGKTLRLAYRSGLARTDPGWRASWKLPGITTGAAVLGGVALLSGISAVGFVAAGRFGCALAASAGCYTLVGLGAVLTGPLFTLPWLLRWPASCALGLLALVGLNGDWWASAAPTWQSTLVPAGFLVGAGFGYLVIEVRNHNVWGAPALRRACAVLGVGLFHSLLVSLVGLVGVLPTFAEDGGRLAALFTDPNHDPAQRVLLLATAWCLAVGVFSQILWDDRPITAPLAHAGWRGGNDT